MLSEWAILSHDFYFQFPNKMTLCGIHLLVTLIHRFLKTRSSSVYPVGLLPLNTLTLLLSTYCFVLIYFSFVSLQNFVFFLIAKMDFWRPEPLMYFLCVASPVQNLRYFSSNAWITPSDSLSPPWHCLSPSLSLAVYHPREIWFCRNSI